MPNPTKGEVRWTQDGPVARITIGRRADGKKERVSLLLETCKTEPEAAERAKVLAELAQRFRKANLTGSVDARRLLEMAASATSARLSGVLKVAGELIGGELVDRSAGPLCPTFKDFAEEWTSGKLHKAHPHHIKLIIQENNEQRLKKIVNPLIGHKRLNEVTRADCEAVMSALDPELSQETRRQYAVLLNRILNLAEYVGHIDRNPLPRGWLPSSGPSKRYPILYPSEDAKLLGCRKVPLADRLLWGFLHREGLRRGEAVGLQFFELDFEHETIALDKNKTDHPRWWKLAPGVAQALKAWRDQRDAKPEDRVFIDENGGPVDTDHIAERLRVQLRAAGITRADLYSVSPLKAQFNVHCFRRSFVTRSLAAGKNEDFVRQRTGHTSDELLTYRQDARSVAELELGDVGPLFGLIPELSEGQFSWPPDGPAIGRGGPIRTGDPQTPSLVR